MTNASLGMIANYKNMVANLERQELESSVHGSVSPQVYGQLLAIYLLMNDLPNAKLLWKRIPEEVKLENEEIKAVWNVGVKLFKHELPQIYSLVDETEWPSHLKTIMNCMKVSTRDRMVTLISKAYTSIKVANLSAFLGLSRSETIEKARELGWNYNVESDDITPLGPPTPMDDPSSATFDELMTKLTEYVSFLEN